MVSHVMPGALVRQMASHRPRHLGARLLSSSGVHGVNWRQASIGSPPVVPCCSPTQECQQVLTCLRQPLSPSWSGTRCVLA